MAKKTTDPAAGLFTTLGVDIGGTGMKGGIVQLGEGPKTGRLVGDRFRIPTPQPAVPEAVASVLTEIVGELDTRPGAPSRTLPVGIDFPAVIHQGVCLTATNMDASWIDTDVDGLFSEALKRPVSTVNDADAAGLAEVRYGAGKGVQGTVLVITLGTGIGAGLFRDGELVPNLELGTIELDGAVAETRASAAAREREGLDWPAYAERLQRYFSYVERIFYPDLIIVGGGISKRPDDYLPLLDLRSPIVPAALKNNAGIVGAALWATDAVAGTATRQALLGTARKAADQAMAQRSVDDGTDPAKGVRKSDKKSDKKAGKKATQQAAQAADQAIRTSGRAAK